MEILRNEKDLLRLNGPTAVTVGKFDCIHLGHDSLLSRLRSKKQAGLSSLVFTFSVTPRLLLNGREGDPFHGRNLLTNAERAELLSEKGMDYVYERPFDEEFMNVTAEDFVRFLTEKLRMKYICVTADFRFGKGNAGDAELLKKLSETEGFKVEVLPILKNSEDNVISSSLIRERLKAGEIAGVNSLLGYEYFIHGKIVHGEGIGKKRLSYATINMLPPDDKLLPKVGVYVTRIEMSGKEYYGMTDIGFKPTVDLPEKKLGVETHIFDFDGNAYEKEAKVSFLTFLRDERKFPDFAGLQEQIERDERASKKFISEMLQKC